MDTSFAEDLELESIEFVALAEVLQELYGERVDFVAWISKLELDEIIQLTWGKLWSLSTVPLVTANGIQMHTQTLGSGPPFLCWTTHRKHGDLVFHGCADSC